MSLLRAVPAAILAGASAILSGGAKLAEMGARRLAPPARTPTDSTRRPSPGRLAGAASERLESSGAAVGAAISTAGQDLGDRVEATTSAVADSVQDAGDAAEADLDARLRAGSDLAVDADVVTDADLGTDTTAELPPQPDDTGIVADLPPMDDSIVDDVGGQARTYESHIAELADQNVSAVVRGIQDLSTEELGQLFDYESAHRKRKTVLQAIERASAPEAEETVYTTESPAYDQGNPPL